jgi:hypothetical protein
LIGLQFVALALIADKPQFICPGRRRVSSRRRRPLHGAALAATLRARPGVRPPGALGARGFERRARSIVAQRVRRQTTYRPDLEDWLFHSLLPLAAYAVIALSALAAHTHAHEALLGVGAATLLLLFVGIHNAWDAGSYCVFVSMRKAKDRESPSE